MKKLFFLAVVMVFAFCSTALALDMKGMTEDVKLGDKDFPPQMLSFVFNVKGSDLYGIVYLAEGKGPHPTALILHGFPGNEKTLDLAQSLRRAGINTVFFGFRGAWGSQGDFSYQNCIDDAVAAVKFFQTPENAQKFRTDPAKIMVMGHSMGGFVTMNVANQLDDVKTFVFIAGWNLGAEGKALAKADAETVNKRKAGLAASAAPLKGTNADALFDEIVSMQDSHDLMNFVPNLKGKKILMLAAKNDTACPMPTNHQPLFDALKKAYPDDVAEYVMDTDHVFSHTRMEMTKAVFEWLQSIGF